MKKIFIICLFSLSLFATCFAADILPKYSTSINHFGVGIVQLQTLTKIYETNDEQSDIIQKIYWDTQGNFKTYDRAPQSSTFIAYIPKSNKAFLSVEDEDENWYYVCYNQKENLYGWVKKDDVVKFYTWFEFIDILGRKNSIYTFNDIKQEEKVLYAKPENDAQVIDTWQFPKYILPWHVNGNWVMVKLIDFDRTQKVGYLKWRNEDGRLNVFVKLK